MSLLLDSHICYLLHEHNCVVIPGFGGFVANYQKAKIDKNLNLLRPPTKNIVFNKRLQNNDGLLINEVASSEGINFQEAAKQVASFVENLKENLSLHKKLTIEGVGELVVSNDNTVLFIQDSNTNHLLSSFGTKSIQIKEIQRVSVSSKIGEKIKHLEPSRLNKKSWLKIAAVIIPLITLSIFGITQQNQLEKTFANLYPFEEALEILEPMNVTNELSEYKACSPVVNIDLALKNIDLDTNQTQISTKKHFIIAGAFGVEHNAINLVEKLKKLEFKNAYIIGKNKNNLYRVAYDGFVNPEEALSSLRKIKETYTEAWLLSI